jgi:signal transduction histidine kinase
VEVRNGTIPYRGGSVSMIAISDVTQQKRDRERICLLEQQKAVESERVRVARDMHDELGANLTRIKLLSERVERDALDAEKVVAYAQLISKNSRELAERMDQIVWAVNPQMDNLEHLVSYLVSFADEFVGLASLRIRFDVPGALPEIPVSAHVRLSLFSAVKEALNNAVKHARATEIRIGVRVRDERLELEVTDDGCGIPRHKLHSAVGGLNNLRHRLRGIGGDFVIESQPGQGTRIRMALLCQRAAEQPVTVNWKWKNSPDRDSVQANPAYYVMPAGLAKPLKALIGLYAY